MAMAQQRRLTVLVADDEPHVRVLMMTAKDTVVSVQQCLDRGARHHGLKASPPQELFELFELFSGSGTSSSGNTPRRRHDGAAAEPASTGASRSTSSCVTQSLRDGLLAGSNHSELRALAARGGYRPMSHDGLKKALCGLTTLGEVVQATSQARD